MVQVLAAVIFLGFVGFEFVELLGERRLTRMVSGVLAIAIMLSVYVWPEAIPEAADRIADYVVSDFMSTVPTGD